MLHREPASAAWGSRADVGVRPPRVVALLLAIALGAAGQSVDEVQKGFVNPPEDAKIMMRWWWFGPSVTKEGIESELQKMKEGGIGGFEVQPVYPLALDDAPRGFRNYPYLSDEFIEMLRFTSQRARELGLRMDLTLGSGWPFGGPHIPVTQAAGRIRVDRIPVPAHAKHIASPDIGAGEKLIAVFLTTGDPRNPDTKNAKPLASLEAALHQEQPKLVLAFIASRTGQQVKRAALDAEGFVLDHYDRAAIENHLRHNGDRIMQAFGKNPPRAVFSDSLEAFASDWTPDLPAEFQKRRGYDLMPYLPALIGDIGPETGGVRVDWARTLTELANERYLAPIAEWAHRNGTLFRSQTYGTPPVTLSSNSIVDLPEGEQPYWRKFTPSRWAASASHLYGKPVTSSETWTWLHSPSFRATPLDMKAEADLHFLIGVNQLVGHGWAYSPEYAGEPGWRFYAAAVFNHHNPWWIVMPDVTKYLQRVSYLLRQGKAANDVAVYLPTHDARARFVAGRVSVDREFDAVMGHTVTEQILDAGYNYDFIDDEAIERLGVPYPILVLPGVERISPAAYRKIAEYRAKGGIVVATKRLPALAPGLKEPATEVVALSKTVPRLVADETKLGAALNALLPPDFKRDAPAVGFIHRKLEDADLYFVANTSNQAVRTQAGFRAAGKTVEAWNPFSGQVANANSTLLELAPYESRVLVLSSRPVHATGLVLPVKDTVDLSTGWSLSIDGKNVDAWPDYYSGVVSYQRALAFSGSQAMLDFGEGTALPAPGGNKPGMRALLDSPVREAAVVYVNGRKAGVVWHPPFQLDISAFVKRGENVVRVDVANTAINRMAGEGLPNYRLLNIRYGERFTPQDMENLKPVESGISGRVQLIVR